MKINVAYACDEHYIKQTGISMISLFENNKDLDEIIVYIIDFGIKKSSVDQIRQITEKYGRKLELIDFKIWRDDLHVKHLGRHIESVYAKIFFGRIEDISKILYLDSDVIITDSLRPLWKINMSSYWIAGVETISSVKRNNKMGIEGTDICLNDGVLLMNLDNWRENQVEKKCLRYIEQMNGDPFVLSEGTLNNVCRGHILKLHPRYNLLSGLVYYSNKEISLTTGRKFYSDKRLEEARKMPCIVHYLCGFYLRPWNSNCKHPLKNYYETYRELSPWKNEKRLPGKLKFKFKVIDFLHSFLPWRVYCQLIRLVEQTK